MKITFLGVGLAVAMLIVLGLAGAFSFDKLGGGQPIVTSTRGTNSTVSVTSTVKAIITADSSSQIIVIANVGDKDAWISATTTNLVANYGWWIKASSSEVMTGDRLYTGTIYGVGTGTTTLSIFKL